MRILVICVFLWLTVSSSLRAREISETVYRLKPSLAAVDEWETGDPEVAVVEYLPEGGGNGKGALRLRILKTIPGEIRLVGPAIVLPARPEAATRAFRMELLAKAVNFNTAKLQLGVVSTNGRWARARSIRRDNNAIIDIVNGMEYNVWRNTENIGYIDKDFTSGQLVLTLETGHQPGGELLIESLSIEEIVTLAHQIDTGVVFNHYYSDRGSFTVRWYRPEEMTSGEIILRDEEEQIVNTLPVVGGTDQSQVTLNARGFYAVTALGRYQDGAEIRTNTTLMLVGALIPETERRASRYGIMRVWANEDWGVRMGINHDGAFWNLDNTELTPDGRVILKKPVSKRKTPRPFTMHLAMNGNYPPWLRSPEAKRDEFLPPRDWDLFEKAVEAWAAGQPDLPDIIVPYNEPDSHWRGTKDDLVRFHNVVTDAIKRVRPEAKVGGPAICRLDIPRLKPFVDSGILKNMDAVVMHAYVDATPPEHQFYKNIAAMQEYLRDAGYGHLPFYLTEFGWTGPPGDWQKPVDELTKARYAVRSMLLCTVRDVDAAIYFCGKFSRIADKPQYSIVTLENLPLPAAAALGIFLREMTTVKGGGVFLSLAPEVYAAFFKRGENTLAAYWSGASEQTITFPMRPKQITHMMGRDLPVAETFKVTPSPVYVEFAGHTLAEFLRDEKQLLSPGQSVEVDGSNLLPPPFAKIHDSRVQFDDNAPLGDYTVLAFKQGKPVAYQFTLLMPFEIAVLGERWNAQANTMELLATVESRIAENLEGTVRVVADRQVATAHPVHMRGNSQQQFLFPLSAPSGQRITGSVVLETHQPLERVMTAEFDTTPLTVSYFRRVCDPSVWERIQTIAASSWMQPGEISEKDRSDAEVELAMFADPAGMHLRVIVDDPIHQQESLIPYMWREDSVQFAFDLDTDDPWSVNDPGNYYQGHRITGYAVARSSKNGIFNAWCHTPFADNVNNGPGYLLYKTCTIDRDDASGKTTYRLLIPWSALGISEMPDAKKRLGFALLVNDSNRKGRTMIPFFHGIAKFDPALFGKIQFINSDD